MRASTFFAAAAALATTVSAGMVPTFAKRYNITQAWGEWEVTNFTASSHPSSSSIDFLIFWDKGNSGPVHCNANGYSVGGEGNWYACESNNTPSGNFHFSLNQDWNSKSSSTLSTTFCNNSDFFFFFFATRPFPLSGHVPDRLHRPPERQRSFRDQMGLQHCWLRGHRRPLLRPRSLRVSHSAQRHHHCSRVLLQEVKSDLRGFDSLMESSR